MTEILTPGERSALQQLWQADTLNGMDPMYPTFPGAVGRSGALLATRGLAEKVGMFTYETGCRYTRYKITDAGRRVAVSLLASDSEVA